MDAPGMLKVQSIKEILEDESLQTVKAVKNKMCSKFPVNVCIAFHRMLLIVLRFWLRLFILKFLNKIDFRRSIMKKIVLLPTWNPTKLVCWKLSIRQILQK